MYDIEKVSTDELQAELKRRYEVKQKQDKPKMFHTINPESLRKVCQDYIDELNEKGYADEDFDHYIYEAAVEMFFGNDVWAWINEKTE